MVVVPSRRGRGPSVAPRGGPSRPASSSRRGVVPEALAARIRPSFPHRCLATSGAHVTGLCAVEASARIRCREATSSGPPGDSTRRRAARTDPGSTTEGSPRTPCQPGSTPSRCRQLGGPSTSAAGGGVVHRGRDPRRGGCSVRRRPPDRAPSCARGGRGTGQRAPSRRAAPRGAGEGSGPRSPSRPWAPGRPARRGGRLVRVRCQRPSDGRGPSRPSELRPSRELAGSDIRGSRPRRLASPLPGRRHHARGGVWATSSRSEAS